MKCEVTVIIPTYNRVSMLPRALESVLRPDWDESWQLLVVDDGSTDGTQDQLASKYPQVEWITLPEQRGPSAARNEGIRQAKGEWIAFLDSDDTWEERKIQAQLNFFSRNSDIKICQTEEIWIRNGTRVNPMKKHAKPEGDVYQSCLPLCCISPSAVMIHQSVFDDVGLFDESLLCCEDYDLWLRISCKYQVGLISKPYVVKYGGHEDQQSHAFPAMDRFRIQALVKILKSGELTPQQTQWTLEALREKFAIYTQGALKRGKKKEVLELQELLKSVL